MSEQLTSKTEVVTEYQSGWNDGYDAAVRMMRAASEPSDGRFEVYFRPSTGERGIIDDGAGGVKLTVDTSFFGSDQETLRYCSRIASLLNQVTNVPDGTSASGNARAIDERSDDGRIETTEVSTSEPPHASLSLEGIENTIIWLESAVKCASFKWDADQKAAAEESYLQAKGEVWALKKQCANPVPSCTHPVLVDSVEQPGKDIYTCPRCNVEVRIFHSEIRPRAAVTKDARCVWSKNCERPPREGSLLCDEHYGQAGETDERLKHHIYCKSMYADPAIGTAYPCNCSAESEEATP